MMRSALSLFTLLVVMVFAPGSTPAAVRTPLKKVNITLDQPTLRKGLHVFVNVCMGCHSMRYVTWYDLTRYPEIALSRKETKELSGGDPLTAHLLTPLSEKDAKASFGIVPPDLSLMAMAREGKGAYIYSILTGFAHDPRGRVPDGNYNLYFPGHRIAMPDPLGWLDHDPGDTAKLQEQARTVASFLTFVGDPHQLQRLAIGKWVMIFLVVMTFVLWLLKREVWRNVEH